jgi:aspartate/glutamate racemase
LRDLVQVFDEEVAHPLGIPGTMMTNAGDVTWAIEFRGQDIIDALGGMVASFSVRDPDPRVEPRLRSVAEPKTIGIITGNAPESGMLLWERINMGVRDALGEDCYGDVSMPRVLVDSLPELGMTMELEYRSRDVWQRLSRTVSRLCEGGADLLTVACNTTPFFSEKIRSLAGHSTQVVMMPEIVRDHVVQQGIREVGLVGIRYVTHEGEWSAYASALQEVEVERPSPRLTAEIERLGYQVKTNGPSSDGLQRLFQLLRREFSSRCIVIALTELSLLLDLPRGRLHTERELIDPLRHYADAIVAFCVRRTDEG